MKLEIYTIGKRHSVLHIAGKVMITTGNSEEVENALPTILSRMALVEKRP